jgi:predicted nucleic acid-binding protein
MDAAVMVDACIFIDFFRISGGRRAYLTDLLDRYERCYASAVAKYEVLCGALDEDIAFWNSTFQQIEVLPFDNVTIMTARRIYRQLKRDNKIIDISDILIAATAIVNDLPLATFNRDHFERIRGLRLA